MKPVGTFERRIYLALMGIFALAALTSLIVLVAQGGSGYELVLAVCSSSLFCGAFLAYTRGVEAARLVMVIVPTLIVGLLLPEPFVTQEFSISVFIPPALALIFGRPAHIPLSALFTRSALIIRAGGAGVYTEPVGLIITGMIDASLFLGRVLADHARRQAEIQAVALERERASLAERVAERTQELTLANAELLRASQLKSAFLAGISHELRTPLNIMLGNVELMAEGIYGSVSEAQQSALAQIERSGQHLLSLISDILDLSKIEAGAFQIAPEQVELAPIVEGCVQIISAQARAGRLALSHTIDPALTTLWVDPRRLRQILLNLLSNAVKFTPPGGSIVVRVWGDAEAGLVCFSVADTGIGIADEHRHMLFRPFTQIDSGIDRRYEGTGLGLALIAELVARQGGTVEVESRLGQGSTFTVALPWRTGPG